MRFPPFRLDIDSQQLWRETELLIVRPKPFAVLTYLVEHAGQLVTQKELRHAVWEDVYVGEDVVRAYIRDLREILGDDPAHPQFIETIPRRGYRFIGKVVSSQQPAASSEEEARGWRLEPSPPSPQVSSLQPLASTIVGRDAELAQLHDFYGKAHNGERQLVFVTGEPGIGKTALVEAFIRQIPTNAAVVMHGQCVEQYGSGEAYLPVLEALGRLCRQPGGEVIVELLRRYAPTWLVQMPALVTDSEFEALQRRVQGAARERMLREFAELMEVFTARQPLILILEDLHWSDYSTLDILRIVARRREPARLFVLGTYRPAELIVNEHPLRALLPELRSHHQCEEVSLSFLTVEAIRQYLTNRFGVEVLSHSVSPSLDAAMLLYERTDGNPLFVINVVNYWVSEKRLVATDGQWRFVAHRDALRDGVPEDLFAMIERQVQRLIPDEQHLLEVASVVGREFTAAIVAVAGDRLAEEVELLCEQLTKRGDFLHNLGIDTVPNGPVTGRYRFTHALYQQGLYARLAPRRRVQLHRNIAEGEKTLLDNRGAERAAELAMHFEQGQDYSQALIHLQQAARNAERRYASKDTIRLLQKGLDLIPSLPDPTERPVRELALQLALLAPLSAVAGYASSRVEQALRRAAILCEQTGRRGSSLLLVLSRFTGLYLIRGQLHAAREEGMRFLQQAQAANDPLFCLWASYLFGEVSYSRGDLTQALTHYDAACALYPGQEQSFQTFQGVDDPGINSLVGSGMTLWFLGFPVQAEQRLQEGLRQAERRGFPLIRTHALYFAGWFYLLCGKILEGKQYVDHLLALATEHELPHRLAAGKTLLGWVLAEHRQVEESLSQLLQGQRLWLEVGTGVTRSHVLTLLAQTHAQVGQVTEGLTCLEEAIAWMTESEGRFLEAEVYRLKGELLLVRGSTEQRARSKKSEALGVRRRQHNPTVPKLTSQLPDSPSEAEECFCKAIDIACAQQAKSLELRATMSLARLWHSQGKTLQAHELVSAIYSWFTEGFETKDLQEAKTLLEELSEAERA